MTEKTQTTLARESLELERDEMAAALNVHRMTLVKWERGEHKPPAAAVRATELLQFLHKKNLLREFIETQTTN